VRALLSRQALSSVVLTWNSVRHIERCLASLVEDARAARFDLRVLVVDGGSADGTLNVLAHLGGQYSEIEVIELGRNLGTTVARNIAIKRTSTTHVLVLDSDTEVRPGTLTTLLQSLDGVPRAGIVAPRLVYPDGGVQASCKRFPTAPLKACKFLPFRWGRQIGERSELYPPDVYSSEFRDTIEVDHCISACWLVRREALDEVGLLDERIFYAPEDVDYCLRMWLAGWKVAYVPTAVVVHHAQRVSYRSRRVAWVHAKGLTYYFRKHRYLIRRSRLYSRIPGGEPGARRIQLLRDSERAGAGWSKPLAE